MLAGHAGQVGYASPGWRHDQPTGRNDLLSRKNTQPFPAVIAGRLRFASLSSQIDNTVGISESASGLPLASSQRRLGTHAGKMYMVEYI